MKLLQKKKLFAMAALVILAGLSGCGQTKADAYGAVLSSLTEEQSYAYIEQEGLEYPVLLVTDATWEADGKKEAMYCQVYYVSEDEAKLYGEIVTQGSAYPVSYSPDGIYSAGHHYAARYVLDTESEELTAAEYANETFDEEANVTYSYYSQADGEQVVEDDTYLNKMFDQWGAAEAVDFQQP